MSYCANRTPKYTITAIQATNLSNRFRGISPRLTRLATSHSLPDLRTAFTCSCSDVCRLDFSICLWGCYGNSQTLFLSILFVAGQRCLFRLELDACRPNPGDADLANQSDRPIRRAIVCKLGHEALHPCHYLLRGDFYMGVF